MPLPGWSKNTIRPRVVIFSIHGWIEGTSGRVSQFVNQFETKMMTRGPSPSTRYATWRSPFNAYRVSEDTSES